ncbi:MAG: hypothetical protein JXR37_30835 [Kiritimatiellae bacterium]|nr:hypothetical protein [Kiritimatiellia bacterium]
MQATMSFDIPVEYLREAESIPSFWVTSLEEIAARLDADVSKGSVGVLGTSAGGRPIEFVVYGNARAGRGTTTFSGALGCKDIRAYLGPDHAKRVYMAIGGVHPGEFEGIVGIVNLIAVLETGADLRGKPWPDLLAAAQALDRIVLVPVTNVDGRARMAPRMLPHRGTDNAIYQFFGTGGWAPGRNIGWPACKRNIPLDFSTCAFPGGYPNDAGVNLAHDDFFGAGRQPETEALFALTARERPDLILNMHTGAPPRNFYTRMLRPFTEPLLVPVFEDLYRAIHTRLAVAGLQSSADPALEADPAQARPSVFNMNSALSLHCGALSVTIEAPCHAFSGTDRTGKVVACDPDATLDAQLLCHEEAMKFLIAHGGRAAWGPVREETG